MGICINQWRLVVGSFVQCSVFSSDMTRSNSNGNINISTYLLFYFVLLASVSEPFQYRLDSKPFEAIHKNSNISLCDYNYRINKPVSRVFCYAPSFEYNLGHNIFYLQCKAKANNCITRQINGNIKAPKL